MFYQLGLTRRNTALRVIYLDAILYFVGGLIGTGHHWYFTGQTDFNMALSAMFSVLEVVPLTLLTLDAWDFVRTTRGDCEVCGKPVAIPHKWTFYFLMAVGFWNFVGAGMFGFLINLPIVSYYEVGTHPHAQPRPRRDDGRVRHAGDRADGVRAAPDQPTRRAGPASRNTSRSRFWGTNIGLAMMVVLSLFPGGVLQVWDVVQNGYWHARSLDYTGSEPVAPDRVAAPARRPGVHLLRRGAARDRCFQRLDWPPSTGEQLIPIRGRKLSSRARCKPCVCARREIRQPCRQPRRRHRARPAGRRVRHDSDF